MMTRDHHRRRSPESSRRRRKERRDSRERLQIQPVPLPITRYEEQDEHQDETARAFSPLSSSSSTSSSLLNISRPSQRFGLGRFFGGGQKQHRVKKKRRFLKFGNSSSSSVGSDLAYGKGYIEKGRSREFSPPTSSHGRPAASRRSQTDEEILELGRKFAEIARQQNAEDLRAAGRSRPSALIGAASAFSQFRRTNSGNSNRGIGSSKPRRDSSPDDSEWESASDDDDSSSSEFDSGLAYGSGLSLQASAAPPPQSPQSPRSPSRLFSSPRSLLSPQRSPPPHRKPSVVDPNLFGPVNSLHGYVETPCGFDDVDRSTVSAQRRPYEPSIPPSEVLPETRPLQRLYPVPTSDPSNFDAGGSVVSSSRDFPTRTRPAPVPIQPLPIQQPRPIAPVSRKVLDSVETDSRYSERSSKTAIGEAAIAGVAGAAIGAALTSDRRDDREKRESRRDRDGNRRSKRSDVGVRDERTEKRKSRENLGETREVREERVDRRREKRSEPDRESERERHWREKIVPELKRESEEKRRRDDDDSDHDHDIVHDKRKDDRKEDREIGRREVRRSGNRDGRRDEDHVSRPTVESYERPEGSGNPPREGPIDPFQFQVADDAFPTPLYTTPKRPLTPNIVTVDREPDFSRLEDKEKDTHTQERFSRRDSYERELGDAHDIYEATEHATAPVSGAAFAAATAAVLAEERRGRSHSRGGDASSRNRSRRGESPKRERDTVIEDANRYYREAELARRIKEEDERTRNSTESSVVDKWKKSERKKPAVEIVQPPEMDHPKKKSPYDGPDADVRIDNVLQHPDELSRFRVPNIEGLSEPPLFKARDPSAERERPLLNIVRPTPVPSPMPEEKRSAEEYFSEPEKEVDVPSSKPTSDAVTESRAEASPAPPTPKVVSWGENQTKHYVVESPEREDDPYSGAKIMMPAKTSRGRRRSTLEKFAAAISGVNDEATSSGIFDRDVDTDPTKPRRASGDETNRRSSAETQRAYDSPPIPGPKPSSLRGAQMPGSFAEDPAFTANIAAALEGSGFDPNIVIDDVSFHKRDSPPGSNESGVYQSPFIESVTDLGTTVAPGPAISQDNQEHGFVIGEVSEIPSDEKDISTDNSQILSELNKRERRKQEKVTEREGYEKPKIIVDDSKPADTSRPAADDDWDPASGKLSKKERKRRERAARAQSLDDGIALDDSSRKDQELEAEFMGAVAADEEESSSLKKRSKKSKRAVIVQEAPRHPDVSESSKVIVPVDAFQDIQDAKGAERPKITIPVNAYQDVQDAKTVQLDDKWDLQKSRSESKRDPEIYDPLSRSVSKPENLEESTRDIVDSRAASIPDEEHDSPRKNSRRPKRDSGAYGSPSRPAPLSELSMESSYRVVDTDSIPATEDEWDTPRKSKKKSKRDSEIFGSPSRPALDSEPSMEIVRKDTIPDTTSIPEDDQNVSMKKRSRRGTIDDEFAASPAQSIADWDTPKESRRSKLDSIISESPPRVGSSEDIVESPKEMTVPFSDWRSEKTTVTEEEPSTPKKSKKKSKRDSTIHEELPSTPVSRSATPSVSSSKRSKRDSGIYDSPSRSTPVSDIGTDSSPKKGKKKKKRPSTPGDVPEDDGKPGESEPPDRGKDQVEVSDRDIGSILSDTNRYDDQRPGKGPARFDIADDERSITSIPSGSDRKDRKGTKSDKDKKSGGNSSFFDRFRSTIGIAEEKERSRKSEEDKKNSFLDNADTLGAGVGSMGVAITPSPQESRSNAINAPLEEEAQIVPSTPERQSTLPLEAEFIDPEIAPREIRPAIDPKHGDLLPLPPSRPGSPVPELSDDFPDLPESRPETPEHERHLREIHSHVRRRSAHETPTSRPRTPSQSAIPISFRLGHRHTPSNGRSSPLASPIVGNSDIGSEPRSRSRPISWEGAREFKPLLLLQRASRGSIGSVGSLEIASSPERESPLRDVSPSESEIHEHRSQSLRRLLAESPDRNQPSRDSAFTTPAYNTPGVSTPIEHTSAIDATHAENSQTPDDGANIKSSHESTHQRDIEIDDHHLEPVPEQPILEAIEDAELPLRKPEPTDIALSSDELSPLTAKRPSDIQFPPSPSTTAATQERADPGETDETPLERNVDVLIPKIEMTEPTPKETELPAEYDERDLNPESEFVDSLEAQDKDMLSSHFFPETEASKSVDTLHTALSHFEDTEPIETASLSEQAPQNDENPQDSKLTEDEAKDPPQIPTNVEAVQIQEEPRRTSRILEQLRAAKQAKESNPVKESRPVEESLPAEGPKEEVQQTSRKIDNSDTKQSAPSPFQSLDQGGWLSSFRSSWRSGLLPRPWQLPKATDNKDNENDTKSSTTVEASPSEPAGLESREAQPEEASKEVTSTPEPESEASNIRQNVNSSSKKSKKKKRKSQVLEPSLDQPSVANTEDTSLDKTIAQATGKDQKDLLIPQESLDAQPIIPDTQDTALDETPAEPSQDVQPNPIAQEPLDAEPIVRDTQDSDLDKHLTNLPGDDQRDIQPDAIVPQEPLDVLPVAIDVRDASTSKSPTQLTGADQPENQQDVQPGSLPDFQSGVQSDVIVPQESLDVRPVITDTRDISLDKAFAKSTGDDRPEDQPDVQPDILPDAQDDVFIPQESLDAHPVLTDTQDASLDEVPAEPTMDQPDVDPLVESDAQPYVQPDVVTQESFDIQPAATDTQDIDLNKTFTQPSENESHDVQPTLTEEVPAQETVFTEEPAELEKELSVKEAPTLELDAPLNEPLPLLKPEPELTPTENATSLVETKIDAQSANSTELKATSSTPQITAESKSLTPQPEPSTLEVEPVATEPESIAIEPVVSAVEVEPTRSQLESKDVATAEVDAKDTTTAELETTGAEKEIPMEMETTVVESENLSSKPDLTVEPEPTVIEREPVIAEQVTPIAEAEPNSTEVAPIHTEEEPSFTEEPTVVEDEMIESTASLPNPSGDIPKKEKKKKKKKGKKQQSSENDQDEPATPLEESVQSEELPTQGTIVEKSDVPPAESQISMQDRPVNADILDANSEETPTQLDQLNTAVLEGSRDVQPSLPEETPSTPKKSKKKKRGKKAQTSEPEPEAETTGEQMPTEEEKSQPLPVEAPSLPVVQEAISTPQPENHRPHSPPIGDVEVLIDRTETEHQFIPSAEEKLVREDLPLEGPQASGELGRDEETSCQLTSPSEPAVPVSTEPHADSLEDRQPIHTSEIRQEEQTLPTPQAVVEEIQSPSEIVKSEESTEFSIPHEDAKIEQQHDGQRTLMETSSESPVAQDSKPLEQVNVDESSLQPNLLLGGEHARDHQAPASIAPLEAPLSRPNSAEGLQVKSPEQIEVVQKPSAESMVVNDPQSSDLPAEPTVEQPQEMALPQEEPSSKKKGKKNKKKRQDTSESVDTPVDTSVDTDTIQELAPQIIPSETIVDELPVASEVQEKPSEESTEVAGDDALPEPTKSSKKPKKGKKKRQKSDATDMVDEPEAPKADAQVLEPIPIQDDASATVTTDPAIESTPQPEVVAQVAKEQAKDISPALPSEDQESAPLTEKPVQPSEKLDATVQSVNPEEQVESTQVEEPPQLAGAVQPEDSLELGEPVQTQEPIVLEEPPQQEPLSNVERSLDPEEPLKVEEPTKLEEFMQSEPTLEVAAKTEEVELPSETAGDVIRGIDSENQAGPIQIDEPSKLDESLQPTESTQLDTSEVSRPIADEAQLLGDDVLRQDISSNKYEEEGKEARQAIDAPALTDEPKSSKSVEDLTAVETGAEDRQIVDDFRLPTSDLGPAASDQLEAQAPEPESTPSKKQAKKDKKKKKKRGSIQNESIASDIPQDAPQASDAQPIVDEQLSTNDQVAPQTEPSTNVDTTTGDKQVNEAQDETADEALKLEESKGEDEQNQLLTGTEETLSHPIVAPEVSAEPSTVSEETEQSKKEVLESESTPTTPKKSKNKKKKKRQSVQLVEPSEQSTMESPIQPDVEFPESAPAFNPDWASVDPAPPQDSSPKPGGDHDVKSGGADDLLSPEKVPLQDEAIDPLDKLSQHGESKQMSDVPIDEGDKLEPHDTNVPAILENVEINTPKDQLPAETSLNEGTDNDQKPSDKVLPIEEQSTDKEHPIEATIVQEPTVHDETPAEIVRSDKDTLPAETNASGVMQLQDETLETTETQTEVNVVAIPQVDEPTPTAIGVEDDQSREPKQVDSQPTIEEAFTTITDTASPEETLPEVSTPKKTSKKKKKRASQVDLELESGTATPLESQEQEHQTQVVLPEETPVRETTEQPESQPIVEEPMPVKEEILEALPVVSPSKMSKKERRKAKKLAEAEAANDSEPQHDLQVEGGSAEPAGAEVPSTHTDQPKELPTEQISEQRTESMEPTSEVDLPTTGTISEDIQGESLQPPVVSAEPPTHFDKDQVANTVDDVEEETAIPTDQEQSHSKSEDLNIAPESDDVANDISTDKSIDQPNQLVEKVEANQESAIPPTEKDKPDSQDTSASTMPEQPSVHLDKDHVDDVIENIEGVTTTPIDSMQSLPKPKQDSSIPLESENVSKNTAMVDNADATIIETAHEPLNDPTRPCTTVLEKDEKEAELLTPKLDNEQVSHSDSMSRDLPGPKEDKVATSGEPLVVEKQPVEPSDIPESSETFTKDIEQEQLPADQNAEPDVTIAKEPESQPSSPVSRKKSKRDKKKKRASIQAESEPVSGTQTPSNEEAIPSSEPSTTNTTEPLSQEPVETKPNEGEWTESPAKSKRDKKRRKATGTSTPMESMEDVPANAPSGTMTEENAPGKLTQEEILEVEGHSSTKDIQEEPSPNPENQDENAEDFNISHLIKETVADSENNQLAPPTKDEHRAQRDGALANEPAQDIQGHVELSAPTSPPRTPLTTATPMIDVDLSPAQLSSRVEHDRPFDQSPQPGKKARTRLSKDEAMIPEPLSAPADIPRIIEGSTREVPESLHPPDQHMTGTEEGDAAQQDITPAREIAASYLESQPISIGDKHATVGENSLIEQVSNAGLLPVITPQREIAASYFEGRSTEEVQTADHEPEDNTESVAGGVQIVHEDNSPASQLELQPTQQGPKLVEEEKTQPMTPTIAREPSPTHDATPSAREIAATLMESRPRSSGKQTEPSNDPGSSAEDVSFTFPAGGASLSAENPNDSTESNEKDQQEHVDKRASDKEGKINDSTLHGSPESKMPEEDKRLFATPNAKAEEHTKTPSSESIETKPLGDLLRQDSFPENIESPVVGREVQRDLPEPRDSSQEAATPREPPTSEIIERLDDLDTSENVDESSKSAKEHKIDNALLKSLSPRPTLDYSSSGRNSPRVSLPPVEEETREDLEKERRQNRARDGSKRSSITVEPSRDSGFSTDSPHPKRRSLVDPSLRDSGVHLRDWTEGEPEKAVELPEEEQGSAIRTPQPNEKRSKKLGLGNDTPKLETPVTRSQEDDAQPITDPKKLSRSSSKTSKSYGDLGQQAQQRSVSDNISRSTTPRTEGVPQARRSASNTSISRFSRTRTPDPLRFRPDSPGSYTFRSGNNTPPLLRRVDRRMSGDLRSLSSNLSNNDESRENIHSNQNQSTTPIANEGRVRAKDMTDVYDGYGEGRIGSPRSPTRPQSMRRRQSMQVLELESRVEQLISENRALADAKLHAEQNLNNQAVSAITERDAEIESLKASLEWLRKEVTRLTEINEGLHSANNVLALQHNEKYGQLESRHASTSKELDEFRTARDQFTRTLEQKDAEIQELRAQLEATKEQVREMQQQILASKPPDAEFLRLKDEDHFDHRCQQLCSHVQQWVLRFSKFSDMRACRLTSEINDEKIIDRLDNSVLDGSDVDVYLSDRVRRRDIFMSMTMNMIWEFVFTRYLFGMDREQRQKLKSLEKLLQEVGPPQAVRQWRAVTLTLLSKRPAFGDQRNQDTEAVVQAIFQTLCMILPPPSNLEAQIQSQLRRVMREAVDLSIEMRTQRAEYMMLPPLQPEYDANGDLVRTVSFNAALMNERSGDKKSNEQHEADGAVVRTVLFPLVVKKGDDNGVGDEEIVICPAQVLVAKPQGHAPARMVTPSSDAGGVPLSRGATPMSVAGQSSVSVQMQDAPLPMPTPPHERDYI